MTKRILGYIFIVISGILVLPVIGMVGDIITLLSGLIKIITGAANGYEAGQTVGKLVYWALHFFIIIVSWRIGQRWIKKDATVDTTSKSTETTENK